MKTTCSDYTCKNFRPGEDYDKDKDCPLCWTGAHDATVARSLKREPIPLRNPSHRSHVKIAPSGPAPVHVDKAMAAINREAVPNPSEDMVERIRLQLAVESRDPCKHEGPASEYCMTCNAEVSEQNHVRACLHPNPSPKGTTNIKGTSVETDRDRCTRNNFNNTLQRCWDCPDYEGTRTNAVEAPVRVILDHGAGGLGDAILGLLAVAGLKAENPRTAIVYNCGETVVEFARMFTGPDQVGRNHLSHSDKPVPGARQVNLGYYLHESTNGPERPRWERYAANVGANAIAFPVLREPAKIDAACPPLLRGRVLLFPLSMDPNREWPLFQWIRLDRRLVEAGYSVAVVGNDDRMDGFTSPVVRNLTPEQLTGAIRNASFVVGNDSGPAHLAGLQAVPCQVIGGWWSMANIFGCYPSVRWTQAKVRGHNAGAVHMPEVFREIDARMIASRVAGFSLLDTDRLTTIRDAVASTRKLEGVLAEVGTYRGGVVRLMGLTDPRPWIFVFDTFDGIPETDAAAGGHHVKGDFAAGWPEVKKACEPLKNIVMPVQGWFPQSAYATINPDLRYRVVHVDGDTLQTTDAACRYFAPRMVEGGIMIFDDYDWPSCPGVKPTVDRHFGSRVEQTTATQARVRF